MMKGTRSINTGFRLYVLKPYHITDKIETYNFRGVPEVPLVVGEFKLQVHHGQLRKRLHEASGN